MTFISGDTSVGTDNDRMLRSILGENWRELTGQDKPVMEEGGSRGYSHAAAWAAALREEDTRNGGQGLFFYRTGCPL